MQWLRHIAYFIVFSNIFIACCAVAFTLETFRLLEGTLYLSPLLILIFFATLFIYILQRMFPGQSPDVQNSAMQRWISEHRKLLWVLAGVSIVIASVLFLRISRAEQFLFLLIALITSAYSFPILGTFRLRDLGAVKYLFIALVWSLTTVLLPSLHLGHDLMSREVIFLFAERFVFITAITIPFDIRDVIYDQQALKTQTLPIKIGVKATKQLSYVSIALFLLICGAHQLIFGYSLGWPVMTGLILTGVVTYLTIASIQSNTSAFYYLFYLDGMMIVQFALVEAALAAFSAI